LKDIFLKNSKVCCIADLHIGVHQNSISWHETAIQWARWLKEELIEKKIQDILILGDVYHYRDEVAVNTIHVVHEILDIWKDFNIVIIVGNHDAYYKDKADVNSLSILNGKNNIFVVDKPIKTTIFSKTLTFLPWGSKITDLDKSDILFGHLEIESFKMNSFKVCDHGIKTSDLLDHAKLIFTGHFHLRDEREYNNGTIVYVGNPFEMDFGDTGASKGYYILDIETNKFNFYENNISPKHKKIPLSQLESIITTKSENIEKLINRNIIKFLVDKQTTPDKIDAIIKKLSLYNPFSLSVDYLLYENTIGVDDQNYDASAVDLEKTIEEFISVLDIDNKTDVIKVCLDLYKRISH
jgi:DNA repair exonuclease SbcCD nuclease subunit